VDAVLLILRLALGAVFLVAAIAKLADRGGTRRAIEEFGVPARYAAPGATAVPIAELAATGCLLVPGATRAGAVLTLALLAAFSAATTLNLARGRRPDCHCFGQLHSRPIDGRTLARNGALAVAAIPILVLGWDDPGPSAVAWIADLRGAEVLALVLGILAAAAVAAGGWVAMHLLRQHGRLLLRIDRLEAALAAAGLDVGADEHVHVLPARGILVGLPAPEFEVPAAGGGTSGLGSLVAAGKPALVLFTDAGCGPCQALLPEVAGWQGEHANELTIAVLASGDRGAILAKAEEHELHRVLLDPERRVADAYLANGTPAAVLVAPDGTIASPLAEGADAIRRLVATGLAWEPAEEPGLPIGEEAPRLVLPDLDGAPVALADRLAPRGRTLVVFWNPTCGFCRDMHQDLVAYDRAVDGGSPLLVVSAGEPDEVRAQGFTSVLLDPDSSAASAFGASGTPMGVLVDADGRIASRLAAGASAVLDLTRPFSL
jgi:thiol-disulfide isomerase/thioredoxin